MKGYKHTYGTSLLYTFVMGILAFLPTGFILCVIFNIASENGTSRGEVFLMVIVGCLAFLLALLLFAVVINVVIWLFSTPKMFLGEHSVSYGETVLNYDAIRYVSLYLPEVGTRVSHGAPLILSLYVDDMSHIVVKRPSLVFVIKLKKL